MDENLNAVGSKCYEPSKLDDNSIEMILTRKLMFYIEDSSSGPITVDTGIPLERISKEGKMDDVRTFIEEFNKRYSDATYEIENIGCCVARLPNLMIIVTPTP